MKAKAIYTYSDRYDAYTWTCSNCGKEAEDTVDMAFNYCPHCGKKLSNGGIRLEIPTENLK